MNEYDAAGAFLRQSAALGSVSGAQASWAQVSGTYTTGASCAFVLPFLGVVDATAGSANGTVWFDNVQCWNQTATGQASMPYCELRFPVSPAQLVVSGIQGDMVTPAYLALGTYVASWPPGATLSFWIGARIRSSAGANLIGHLHRQYAAGMATQLSPFTSDFGGWESQLSTDAANVTLAAFSFPPADAIGVWHLLYRIRSLDAFSPSLQKITAHGLQTVSQFPWAGYLANPTALTASVAGPTVNPLPAFGGWVVADAGQLFAYGTSPSGTPTGGLIDPAQNNVTTSLVFNDANAALFDTVNWALLLPVDGGLLLGSMANGASSGVTISTSWLWIYIDGLGTQTNSSGAGAATTSSFESVPVPNPAHGVGGGLGTASSPTSISAAVSTGEPFLVLDPTQHLGGVTVNQLVGLLTNNAGDVLPLHSSLQYWPLYLTLR